MDTVLAILIVLAAAAGIARSAHRRLSLRSGGSCSSGCDGCALASRCGAAPAGGASLPAGPGLPGAGGERARPAPDGRDRLK